MKRFLYFTLFIFIIIFSQSCSNDENSLKVLGKWETIHWVVKNQNKTRSNQMDFHFKENKAYEVDYGSEKEIGKFWFEGNDLYTIEDGGSLKKVEVVRLEQDTIAFEMNRAGQIELVTLARMNEQ